MLPSILSTMDLRLKANKHQQSGHARRNRPNETSGERWKVVRNGHGKVRMKGTQSMDISRKSFIKCTEPINTTAKAARMELWRALLDVECACILTSVLTNTFQLAQRTPQPLGGTQPVAYTCWPGKSEHAKVGIFKRNRHL